MYSSLQPEGIKLSIKGREPTSKLMKRLACATDGNRLLVKLVSERAPKSLLWAPPVYQDLSTRHDCPVKTRAIFNLPIKLKENSKHTSGSSLSSLDAYNKSMGSGSQTLLTRGRLRLRRRLSNKWLNPGRDSKPRPQWWKVNMQWPRGISNKHLREQKRNKSWNMTGLVCITWGQRAINVNRH